MANPRASAVSVGIIMDGNRRWAKARGLPTLEGHRAGLAKAKDIVTHAFSSGVDTIILYAFSTENWNRPPEEVAYLMKLFGVAFMNELADIAKNNVRVRFIGEVARMPENVQAAARELERISADADSGKTLVIALSYGGRAEILAAANRLLGAGVEEVGEKEFAEALWSSDIRDPELIIRTGGEKRLSNFMPWQSVYSELFFSDSFWPEFTREEFDAILKEFGTRERRRGR